MFLARSDVEGQSLNERSDDDGDIAPLSGLLVRNGTFAWPQTVNPFPPDLYSRGLVSRDVYHTIFDGFQMCNVVLAGDGVFVARGWGMRGIRCVVKSYVVA